MTSNVNPLPDTKSFDRYAHRNALHVRVACNDILSDMISLCWANTDY